MALANALDGFQWFSAVFSGFSTGTWSTKPIDFSAAPAMAGMLGAVAKDQPSSDDSFRHPIDSKGTPAFECFADSCRWCDEDSHADGTAR